ITGAYAFTDFRAQGQTLSHVMIDIANPPTGGPLTLFNIYVALSRSSDEYLTLEDNRLAELDKRTREWWKEYVASRV
ncbi:hypothetical protein BKA93DRAFT_703959, partial [Sparassis latifolia]